MFKMIDFDIEHSTDGVQPYMHKFYLLKNINTNKEKWVNEYEYKSIRNEGLLINNN